MLRLLVQPLALVALSGLAVACGDASRVHALLSREARRTYGPAAVAALVRDEQQELRRLSDAVKRPDVRVEASATVLLEDGSQARLTLEDDEFRVSATETLPA